MNPPPRWDNGRVKRLSLGQRIVAVVAFGAICLATGWWVAADYGTAGYATGWTGYAPLAPRSSNVLSPTDLLVVWIGLALIWGAVSTSC